MLFNYRLKWDYFIHCYQFSAVQLACKLRKMLQKPIILQFLKFPIEKLEKTKLDDRQKFGYPDVPPIYYRGLC